MFSVVVPVFNHESYLATAVLSALRSHLVTEVLLVDDGSTDGSLREIRRLEAQHGDRVRDLSRTDEGNLGAHARLNQLVEAAREDWVAVLNSDDAFVAGRFDLLGRRLARSSAEFAFGYLVIIDALGRPLGTKRGVDQPEYPFPRGFRASERIEEGAIASVLANQNVVATTSNLVFKKSLADSTGGFREFRYVHDWDFVLRAALQGPGLFLPHFLSLYRDHGANTIKVRGEDIRAEVQTMFEGLLGDFPDLIERPGVREALSGNQYLEGLPEVA